MSLYLTPGYGVRGNINWIHQFRNTIEFTCIWLKQVKRVTLIQSIPIPFLTTLKKWGSNLQKRILKLWKYSTQCTLQIFFSYVTYAYVQKQPSEVFYKTKDVLKKNRKFQRKTPILESLFDKVACLQVCNFIK